MPKVQTEQADRRKGLSNNKLTGFSLSEAASVGDRLRAHYVPCSPVCPPRRPGRSSWLACWAWTSPSLPGYSPHSKIQRTRRSLPDARPSSLAPGSGWCGQTGRAHLNARRSRRSIARAGCSHRGSGQPGHAQRSAWRPTCRTCGRRSKSAAGRAHLRA